MTGPVSTVSTSILCINDLFLIISSAVLADSVREHKLSALRALYQIV